MSESEQWLWVIGADVVFYGTLALFVGSIVVRLGRARARLRDLS